MSVLHGLQEGNAVLAQIHKEMDIESVEKLLSETQEAREYQQVQPFLSMRHNLTLHIY